MARMREAGRWLMRLTVAEVVLASSAAGIAFAQAPVTMSSPSLIARLSHHVADLWRVFGPIIAALPTIPAELASAASRIASASGGAFGADMMKALAACLLIVAVISWPSLRAGRATADAPHRLAAVIGRFGQDVGVALLAALLAVVISEGFDPGRPSGQLGRALLDYALVLALALMVPAILFRPGEPMLRLWPAHERQIGQARPWLLAAVSLGVGFPSLIPVWLANGMTWTAAQALALVVGVLVATLGGRAVKAFLLPVPGVWPRWRPVAIGAAVLFWLVWSYGVVALDFPFFFAVVRLAAVLIAAVTLDQFIAVAQRTETVAGTGDFWRHYGASLRRVVLVLGIAGAVLVLIGWAAEAGPWLLGPGRLAMLQGRLVEATAEFLLGYLLCEGLCAWLGARYLAPVRPPHFADDSEGAPASRLSTIVPLMRGFLALVILGIATLAALSTLGVDTTPLLAGAGIFGLALSFGSQSLVRDVVAGIFFLADDSFRLGEYIETGKLKGSVERITLRSIQMRHQHGQIHTVPFGQIGSVTNFSRDWVTMKFNLRLARDVDVEAVRKIVKRLGEALLEDPELGAEFLLPLKLQGIADILENAVVMRFKFTVRPGKPTVVRREALKRIVEAFAENGIGFAANTVYVESRDEEERLRDAAADFAVQSASTRDDRHPGQGRIPAVAPQV